MEGGNVTNVVTCSSHGVDIMSQVLTTYEAAQVDVEGKAEELGEIAKRHEQATALADKIKGVEVDISHQLQEYTKVGVCVCFVCFRPLPELCRRR